jgi:hypothetical protein
VREYGGDYRNIQYDFGDAEELSSAVLYLDMRILHPGLFQWRVFVTDDPEGRIWNELGPDRASVEYREWDTGLQGWEVAFLGDVSARHVKMVNIKFGFTEPDLFVTELEVYTRQVTEARKSESNSQDYRLNGNVGYDFTRELDLRYATTIRKRFADRGDLSEKDHGISSRWRPGAYVFTGQYRRSLISREGRRNTDVAHFQLSAGRGAGTRLATKLVWNHAEDRSSGRDQTTNSLSLSAAWKAAPRLRISSGATYGVRSEPIDIANSTSMALLTRVTGQPVPTLNFTFNRGDRWVSQEAGAGFQSFSDTGLNLNWYPVRSISLFGSARHQRREQSDYVTRFIVSWYPLLGRSFDFSVSANSFRDTKVDGTQRSITTTLKWRPRPRLVVDGSVSLQRLEISGNVRTPVNTEIHAAWSF